MYYIVGKDSYDVNGKFIDTNDMNLYWELGWEIMTNHVLIKRWLKEGRIKKNDVIVTRTGGEFIYESVFDNVINFSEFRKINKYRNHMDHFKNGIKNPSNDVFEVMPEGFKMRFNSSYNKNNNLNEKYIHYEEDKDIITNMNFQDVSELHQNKPYVCLNIRIRNWHTQTYRNVKDDYARNIINMLKRQFDKIFIVGFNTEKYNDDKIQFVNLREYSSLVKNPLCKYVIGSMTGFNLLHQLISQAEQTITVDFGNEDFKKFRKDIVGIAEMLRYSPSRFKYFHYRPGIENIILKENGEI